jgi:hypothetical protein
LIEDIEKTFSMHRRGCVFVNASKNGISKPGLVAGELEDGREDNAKKINVTFGSPVV